MREKDGGMKNEKEVGRKKIIRNWRREDGRRNYGNKGEMNVREVKRKGG
jgi:hypothetical protein